MIKKLTVATLLLGGLINSTMVLADNHTVSVGYAQSKVADLENIRGVNLQYRYEWDSPISVIGSFSYMTKGDNDFSKNIDNDVIKANADIKYYSFLAGPAYRINSFVSLYAVAGMAHVKSKGSFEWFNSESNGLVSKGKESLSKNSTSFAYGAGVMINPIENLSINLGYEGTKADIDENHKINGFNIGIGYRF